MAAVEVMDGEVVRRWFRLAAQELGHRRSAIDGLNVFPVPDADTGTNLYRTMVCAADAVAGLPSQAGPAEVWRAAAGAALHGACGNSGIIVSQLLRGLADTCGPASPCDGRVLGIALMNAAALARAAVQRPAEGTVLTVADAAARAAVRVTSLAEVTREAAVGARLALARTEQQLAVLAASGVVDAGAAGLCVVLDALSAAISGTAPGGYAVPEPAGGRGVSAARLAAAALASAPASASASACAYEVTFMIDAAHWQVRELRDRLDQLGDSLVVSGGDPLWHVHVHVADPGAVIEASLRAGRPSRITVTYLHGPGAIGPGPAQASAASGAAVAGSSGEARGPAAGGHRVLAVAQGAGLIRLLRDAGAVVADDRDRAEWDSSVPDAARPTEAKIIIVPNNSPVPVAARSAGHPAPGVADAAGVHGSADRQVIEVGSTVQTIAALAVHDPDRDLADDAAAMRRAVAGMRHASVARWPADDVGEPATDAGADLDTGRAGAGPDLDTGRAGAGPDLDTGRAGAAPDLDWGAIGEAPERPGVSYVGRIGEAPERPGVSYVGRIGDEAMIRGTGQAAVVAAVLDRLLAPGAELVTLLSGRDADQGLAELAAEHVRRLIPAAEVTCYDGGMADAVLLIGAE
ncbi:MAG TPA: DAK2 domain-containing protein [Streptosporangiaceae bacterium]|nr:DAK2 domain-containing protein [Streptosporangiaceae bacterium]